MQDTHLLKVTCGRLVSMSVGISVGKTMMTFFVASLGSRYLMLTVLPLLRDPVPAKNLAIFSIIGLRMKVLFIMTLLETVNAGISFSSVTRALYAVLK